MYLCNSVTPRFEGASPKVAETLHSITMDNLYDKLILEMLEFKKE